MINSLSLFIGGRFSRAKQRNKMVSFISLSSTLGIMVGVAVIIIGLSAMNGFERELENRVLSVVPHGDFSAVNKPIQDWPQLVEHINKQPQAVAAAPFVKFTALAERGTHLKAIQVKGVNAALESEVSSLSQFVQGDAWQNFAPGSNQVVLGKGVADQLGVDVGDGISLMIPVASKNGRTQAPKRVRLKVSGIFSLGGQLDHALAMVPLEDAQSYLGLGDTVSGISVKTTSVFDAPDLMRTLGSSLPVYVYINSWKQEFGYIHRDIQMVRTIMYLVMVLVIGVACFNIVSTLMMAVKDRSAEVAILRTMGAQDSLIKAIFMWQGVLSGVMGAIAGSVLGLLVALNLTTLIQLVEKIIGHKFLSGDVYFVNFLPSEVNPMDVLIVSGTAILLSLVATWFPASKASKLNPATVLSAK
ncbi:lipoprotein-releasing ABC transporter permease subunit LolE [Vibrio breoganii]|uniref:lipoprotein-releasing ABC transporter permease subunit LolE n=1 Tax=Vibrio breoganii TaxID=553239 RepID=UPI00080E0608|nr:lipoprotein-releasing ABC transporter permease subunit LolE [Vibrio breoganii]OCH75533.1 lipoprotein transporter subunit LolE [Vibrio breoganii]PMF81361.1 lipoprotein transporter subunit LolE [Vibrio breoganii]PMG06563.1 lipoprotein transporter subunit LolE [Vibrio breoganii]PMG96927.1 lipoprotein transporter subunit LolE [Vibrio breoganii]PMI22990.1 lipoprotein transporter subunit LolE [Vibrio breoganii]